MSWQRLNDPDFMDWLFGIDENFDVGRSFELSLPATSTHGLRATINEGPMVTLSDLESGKELGWLDDAHFHPSCLRIEEVLHIAASQRDPTLGHLTALLLAPFTVVASDEDAERLKTAIREAWKALGFASPCPTVECADFRGDEVEWYLDEGRHWCLRQNADDLSLRPLYSLRTAEGRPFPTWLSAIGG